LSRTGLGNEVSLSEILDADRKEIVEIKERINSICEKHKIEDAEVLYLIRKSDYSEEIPVEIFSQGLSPLEALVFFLKNNKGLRLSKIAHLLNRDERTIWTTSENSKKKQKKLVLPKRASVLIPVLVFRKTKLSILESVSLYLQKDREMALSDIAATLDKNTSTIWTVISRAKKKGGVNTP